MKNKGWYGDRQRHRLASKGVNTKANGFNSLYPDQSDRDTRFDKEFAHMFTEESLLGTIDYIITNTISKNIRRAYKHGNTIDITELRVDAVRELSEITKLPEEYLLTQYVVVRPIDNAILNEVYKIKQEVKQT